MYLLFERPLPSVVVVPFKQREGKIKDIPRVSLLFVDVNIDEIISRCVPLPRFGSFEIVLTTDRIISLVGIHQNCVAESKQQEVKHGDGTG